MATLGEPFVALSTLIGLIGIAYLYWWRYRALRIDAFRHELFELRDSLFNDAARGIIEFDHPAYLTLRSIVNGYLRFAYRLNIWQIVLVSASGRNHKFNRARHFDWAWNKAKQGLPKETIEKLEEYHERLGNAVFKHVVLTSVEVIPMVLIGALVIKLIKSGSGMRTFWRSIRQWPQKSSDDIAFACGQ